MMLMSDNSCKEKTFVLLISNLSESKSDQRQKISTFTDRTLYHYVDVLSQYSKRDKIVASQHLKQKYLLNYSTIFLNYQLQFREQKSIQKYLDLCSKSIQISSQYLDAYFGIQTPFKSIQIQILSVQVTITGTLFHQGG